MFKNGQNRKQLEKKLVSVQTAELANTCQRKLQSQLLPCCLLFPKPARFGGHSPPSTLWGTVESFGRAGMKQRFVEGLRGLDPAESWGRAEPSADGHVSHGAGSCSLWYKTQKVSAEPNLPQEAVRGDDEWVTPITQTFIFTGCTAWFQEPQ